MRVAILAPENSPSWGGVGSYVYNLVENLPKDMEIHLITLERELNDSYTNLINQNNCYIHNVYNVNKNSKNSIFFANLGFQFAIAKKLNKLNMKYKFDLIHTHAGHLPHFFYQYLHNNIPTLLTVHAETKGLNAVWKQQSSCNNTESLSKLFSPIIEYGETISFKKADRIIPVSRFVRDQILNAYHVDITKKTNVIHNGVDSKLFSFKPKYSLESPVITFIGRFYALKGFDVYLKSLSILKKCNYNVKGLIVGRGDINYVSDSLHALGLSDTCSIVGRKQYHEMSQIYEQSDLIILPSYYESCPGVILEAMSSGKLVIASNIGGIPEIIKDGYNGILFTPGNYNDLAEKIMEVTDNKYDIKKIINNARKTVEEEFNWQKIAIDIKNEYHKMTE